MSTTVLLHEPNLIVPLAADTLLSEMEYAASECQKFYRTYQAVTQFVPERYAANWLEMIEEWEANPASTTDPYVLKVSRAYCLPI